MCNNELYHHGIKGQRWGVRRYRNKDGSLTEEGKKHYQTDEKFKKKYDKYISRKEFWASDKGKRVKKGAIIAGSILTAYGAYKIGKIIRNKYRVSAIKRVADDVHKKNAEIYSKIRLGELDPDVGYSKQTKNLERLWDEYEKHGIQVRNIQEAIKNGANVKETYKKYGVNVRGWKVP
jgi:hypothetical protein